MARVLLIDHDPATAAPLAAALAGAGHDVALERDGVSGLERALDEAFDLVVTEMLLPLLDGAELISALHGSRPRLAVIARTGGDEEFAAQDLIALARFQGAAAGLDKGAPTDLTLHQLRGWLAPTEAEPR